MAIDLALSSGGQRPSRSRRSSQGGGGEIDTGDVTVRTQPTARKTSVVRPGADPKAISALAGSIQKFFAPFIKAAQEEELEEIERSNALEIARLEAAVRQDRNGAREAITTGDFSKFIPDDEMRRRRVIQDSFKILVAQQMAHEDFEGGLRDRIKQTPLDGDPGDEIETFLKDNLQGSDPLFAKFYTRAISRLSEKPVEEFRTSRLELQQVKAERLGMELIRAEIANKEVPTTAEGLRAMRSKITGALPMNPAEAVLRAEAIVDKTLITLAASGDATAFKLAELPDPDRDGTSVFSRNPGKMEEAVASFVKRKQAVRSVEALEELENFEERLALIRLGQSVEGDSLGGLWADLVTHRNRHGDSSKYDTIRDKIVTEINKKGLELGSYKLIAQGNIPGVSNTDWNKIAKSLWDGTALPAIMAEGLSKDAAENRAFQALARRGSGKMVRDANSARLLGSSDSNEVQQTFTRLQSLDVASDRPMKDLHLSEDAAALYHAMVWAQRSGRDPLQVRSQYLEALNANTGEGDPKTHFERRLLNPGTSRGTDKGATQGRGGVSQQASLLWDEIDREDLESAGFFSRLTGGLLGGTALPDYKDLAPVLQDRLETAVNMASFMLSTSNASTEEIRSLAGEMVRGEFGLELGPDGKPTITLDQTPPVAVDANGAPVAGSRVTMPVLERAVKALEHPQAAAVVTAIGGHGGLAQDTLTRSGHGLAVRSMASGFPQDINLIPGAKMIIPIADLPPDMPTTFFEEVQRDDKNGALLIKVPDAPEGGDAARIHLTDSLFMLYDKGRGGWTLRYADQGAPKMTLAELSERNRKARQAPTSGVSDMAIADLESRRRRGDGAAALELAGRAAVGSPVPRPQDSGPVTTAERDSVREQTDETINELQARGIISPQTAMEDDPTKAVKERTDDLLLKERSAGKWLDDITKPSNQRFLTEVTSILEEHEGAVPYVYDDATRRRWSRNAKGNPTIGIGFNLRRPDARKLVEKVGADYDRLLRGEEFLTRKQMTDLVGHAVRETGNWLRRHFDGVEMANHRWMALISLAYNSRWTERGPTLIGPDLTKAVREGQWEEAALEIERDSAKSKKPGIIARRKREADLFRGTLPKS